MNTSPSQNQDDWLGELLDTLDPFVNSHNDFLRRKLIVKAGIIARHQADIERAEAEARKDEALNYDRFLMDDRTPPAEIYSNLTSWSGRRLRELDEQIAALTPKERMGN